MALASEKIPSFKTDKNIEEFPHFITNIKNSAAWTFPQCSILSIVT
jgi:hypothetical protein